MRIRGLKMKKKKMKKSIFGMEMKSFRKESVIIFYQKGGERGQITTFNFFSYTPLKCVKPTFSVPFGIFHPHMCSMHT
jgi:hypothetical protein